MFSDSPNVNPQSTVRKVSVTQVSVTQSLNSQSLYLLTKGNKPVVISIIASDAPVLATHTALEGEPCGWTICVYCC